jgi:hypothetical protein
MRVIINGRARATWKRTCRSPHCKVTSFKLFSHLFYSNNDMYNTVLCINMRQTRNTVLCVVGGDFRLDGSTTGHAQAIVVALAHRLKRRVVGQAFGRFDPGRTFLGAA